LVVLRGLWSPDLNHEFADHVPVVSSVMEIKSGTVLEAWPKFGVLVMYNVINEKCYEGGKLSAFYISYGRDTELLKTQFVTCCWCVFLICVHDMLRLGK
jgi:hypothetical protein